MAEETKAKKVANRIAYVEPNDIYGSVNGVPLTPNYEDYCIGFNLIAEIVSRFNKNETTGSNSASNQNAISISWGAWNRGDSKWQSFMEGGVKDKDGNSYLSTYYTDIVYEDVKGKKIVEGIGVESVNIVFESFYTPTITIKFVDVRGASLFGKEAAIHEEGKISADNVFGCFFTQPYPKFKLQVKGFYGKAVTYQLTCSNFRGSFNSQNGNFEFTATFIGYNYALLTDIPFVYLVAAPFCSYEGRKYWDSHVNTPSWQLDGKPMVKIHELMNTIESHTIERSEETAVNEEDDKKLRDLTGERSALNEISTLYDNFVRVLQEDSGGCYILSTQDEGNNKKHTQLFLMYAQANNADTNPSRNVTQNIYRAHEQLITKLNDYNQKYSEHSISTNEFPNGRNSAMRSIDTLTLIRIFDITTDGSTNSNVIEDVKIVGCQSKAEQDIKTNIKFKTSKGITDLTDDMAKSIANMITTKPYSQNIKQYGCFFDLGDLSNLVANRVASLNEEYNLLQDKINKQMMEARIEALPFKPTIGNIFKMIMAHLETFIHIMYQCKMDIYNSDNARSPGNLGINITDTDVINADKVPPFPAIYTKGTPAQESGNEDTDNYVLGWVGDFSHNFLEEKVVLSIWKAVSRIMDEEKSENDNKTSIKLFPILPADLNSANNPFANTTQLDVSSLGGYLGIRAAQIFGILFNENYTGNLSNEMISLIGRMDAYNYYQALGSSSAIQNEIFDVLGSTNAATALQNITTCDSSADCFGITYQSTGKTRQRFETDIEIKSEYNDKQRCPILTQSSRYSDRYVFSRYYDSNSISLIPAKLDEFDNYSRQFVYRNNGNGNAYFMPQFGSESNMYKANNFIHRAITDDLLVGEEVSVKENYYNDDLFNISTSRTFVNDVINRYEELKKGSVDMVEYSSKDDFTPILNKCWFVSDDKYYNYFANSTQVFTVNTTSYGFDSKNLFPKEKDGGADPLNLRDTSWIDSDKTNGITYSENGEYKRTKITQGNDGKQTQTVENLSRDDLRIHQIKLYYNNVTNPYSLFGHAFYYMQNNRKEGEDDNTYNDRCVKVKALLFLHSFKYNYENYKANFLNKDKRNGSIEAAPHGYLLFLGALLWRNRYVSKHNGDDPIIYSDGTISFTQPTTAYTLFSKDGSEYRFNVMDSGFNGRKYNVPVSTLFSYNNGENWELDYFVENRLIKMFEDYATGDFRDVLSRCELLEGLVRDLSDTSTAYTRPFTANTFVNTFVKFFRKRMYDDKYSISKMMSYYRNRLGNLYGNYAYVNIYDDTINGISLMLRDDNPIQETLKSLYYDKDIVIDSLGYRLVKNSTNAQREVYVRRDTFNSYVTAFANQLKAMSDNKSSTNPLNETDSDKINFKKDIAIDIYYYLKNLYDKWIVQIKSADYYSVDNFFKKNFVFMDKFYRNMYNKFIINCDVLLDIFKERMSDLNASLFSVIGDIAKEHNCLFVSLADFITFGNEKIEDDVKVLENAFKPIPYNQMNEMRDENHFVIIWTGGDAQTASDENGYKADGFDINSPDDIPSPFKAKGANEDTSDIETRYGYNVPSFGVSFARQNQQLFKNITLNMDSPAITSISANVLSNVAELGSSHEHRVMFYGQDIFNIYKNYSYACEVEMMGNAQIQPLMYFQLLNIPMWHGAYMIFHVEHTMTPGNMITKFRGQKMSKYIQPYCADYYFGCTVKDSIDPMNRSESGSNPYSSNISDITLPDSYKKPTVVEDVINDCICSGNGARLQMNGVNLYQKLKDLFNTLVAEIKELPENKPTESWSICISSAVRNSGSRSEHNYVRGGIAPNAIDLQIVPIKNGKRGTRIKDADKMFKVMDILATNHKDEIGQLIFEGTGASKWMDGRYKNDYTCLHLSYRGNSISVGPPAIFLSGNNDGRSFATVKKNVPYYSSNVPPGYKAIAKKYYMSLNNTTQFRNIFTYYRLFSDQELADHFGQIRTATSSESGYVNAEDNATKRRKNPGNLQWIGYPNIKRNSDQWEGVDYGGVEWSPRFAVFKTMTYGLRALFVNMNTQIIRGHNTIAKLIGVWAPSHENDTDNYVKTVARTANVKPSTYRLTSIVADKDVCIAIAKQIAVNEGGIKLTDSELNEAYGLAAEYIKNK